MGTHNSMNPSALYTAQYFYFAGFYPSPSLCYCEVNGPTATLAAALWTHTALHLDREREDGQRHGIFLGRDTDCHIFLFAPVKSGFCKQSEKRLTVSTASTTHQSLIQTGKNINIRILPYASTGQRGRGMQGWRCTCSPRTAVWCGRTCL